METQYRKVMTLEQLADRYVRYRRPSPEMQYQVRLVVRLLRRDVKVTGLDDLNPDVLLDWRDKVLDRASISTWNNYRRHLRVLLNHGLAKGDIEVDPLADVTSVPVAQQRKKTVETGDLEQAFAFLDRPSVIALPWFWKTVLSVFYTTALRRKQAIGLRWSDFRVDTRSMPLQGTLRLRAETSKTRREWEVPLEPEVVQLLLVLRKKTGEAAGTSYLEGGQIFNCNLFIRGAEKRDMSRWQLDRFFKLLTKNVGVRVSAHRMRHTFATQVAESAPTNIKVLQQFLGHTDIRTTLAYVHPDISQMRTLLTGLHVPTPMLRLSPTLLSR
ncbi:site-specific integrase [Solimonas sp. SE-A11]|uniref:tyrosine-type recombinase/integrase n=1 Tax=Solimonas sp. SE-A11 TaxID=3054954 RepID=UPI00259D10A8|nr:site-specific integrase [Solimonas sp. SE-A11]MDM4770929.1 site-specific integrase [Solimonas sp. SE-A11]